MDDLQKEYEQLILSLAEGIMRSSIIPDGHKVSYIEYLQKNGLTEKIVTELKKVFEEEKIPIDPEYRYIPTHNRYKVLTAIARTSVKIKDSTDFFRCSGPSDGLQGANLLGRLHPVAKVRVPVSSCIICHVYSPKPCRVPAARFPASSVAS